MRVLYTGVLACLLAHTSGFAISVFDDRAAWHDSFKDGRWEINLADKENGLAAGETLTSGSPIFLPPNFKHTLTFDSDLQVINGVGWNNYFGTGNPLVLSTQSEKLTGTFQSEEGISKFGFEVLPAISGDLTLLLSDGTSVTKWVDADGAPQFFGWVNTDKDDVAITSFTISGATRGMTVGNFVVPETSSTILLLGLGFAAVLLFRKALPA